MSGSAVAEEPWTTLTSEPIFFTRGKSRREFEVVLSKYGVWRRGVAALVDL